jgi:hypothetical protein
VPERCFDLFKSVRRTQNANRSIQQLLLILILVFPLSALGVNMKIVGYITVIAVSLLIVSLPGISLAGEADVVGVKARSDGEGTWSFSVTVRHDDEGWDHYANQWEILGPDGEVLGTRVLLHPHIGEQPFTRSLGGVKVPEGIRKVTVRARDSVHEYGGKTMEVDLPGEAVRDSE